MSTSPQKGVISEMLADNGNMRGVGEVNADRNERIPLVFTCKPQSQKRSTATVYLYYQQYTYIILKL